MFVFLDSIYYSKFNCFLTLRLGLNCVCMIILSCRHIAGLYRLQINLLETTFLFCASVSIHMPQFSKVFKHTLKCNHVSSLTEMNRTTHAEVKQSLKYFQESGPK